MFGPVALALATLFPHSLAPVALVPAAQVPIATVPTTVIKLPGARLDAPVLPWRGRLGVYSTRPAPLLQLRAVVGCRNLVPSLPLYSTAAAVTPILHPPPCPGSGWPKRYNPHLLLEGCGATAVFFLKRNHTWRRETRVGGGIRTLDPARPSLNMVLSLAIHPSCRVVEENVIRQDGEERERHTTLWSESSLTAIRMNNERHVGQKKWS